MVSYFDYSCRPMTLFHRIPAGGYIWMLNFLQDMWNGKKWFTSCKLLIQFHEPWIKIQELPVETYELRVEIHELRVQKYKLEG